MLYMLYNIILSRSFLLELKMINLVSISFSFYFFLLKEYKMKKTKCDMVKSHMT